MPFDLNRFVEAQDTVYESVSAELRNGHKRGHWMWFIFPQIRGLGRSETADFYGIASRTEAEAYLEHPILGKRLIECTALVNAVEGRSADEIFGFPDVLKFRSSMTLFARVSVEKNIFEAALTKYFGCEPDPLTLKLLK